MEQFMNRIKVVAKKLKLAKSETQALIKLIADLKSSLPDIELKIYRSKVKGTAEEESDLDILIFLPCDVTEEIIGINIRSPLKALKFHV